MKHLSLVIDSNLGDVSLAAVAVHGICIHLGLSEAGASEVELCLVEAMTNAIRHGYHGEAGHTVEVAVDTDEDRVSFAIEDSGTPMGAEPLEKLLAPKDGSGPDTAGPASLTTLAEGGRGLEIIRELMDDVVYRREGCVNQLLLTKRIVPAIAE